MPDKYYISNSKDVYSIVEVSGITTPAEATNSVYNAINIGSGEGLYSNKIGRNLAFKSLIAGDNITLLSTVSGITINSVGGGGSGFPASINQDTIVTAGNAYSISLGQVGGEELTSFNIDTTGNSLWGIGEGGSFTIYTTSSTEGGANMNVMPWGFEFYGGGSNTRVAVGGGVSIETSSNYIQLGSTGVPINLIGYNGADQTSIVLNPDAVTPTITIDSFNNTFEGIKYAQNFSVNFTDRSLVDKEYVDTALGISPPPGAVRTIKSAVPYYQVTSTTGETGTAAILIPANTLEAGDILQIKVMNQKTGANARCDHRLRINTTNSVGGTLVATWNNNATTAVHTLKAFREIFVISPTQTIAGVSTANATTDDASNANPSILNIDWTVNQYLILSSQLGSASDTARLVGYWVNVIKKTG